MNYLEYAEIVVPLRIALSNEYNNKPISLSDKDASDILKYMIANGIIDPSDMLVLNYIMKFNKEPYEKEALDILHSDKITSCNKLDIAINTVENNPEILARRVDYTYFSSAENKEITTTTTYIKEAVKECLRGTVYGINSLLGSIKNSNRINILKDKNVIEDITNAWPQGILKNAIYVFDKNEMEELDDLVKSSLKKIKNSDSMKELVHTYLNRKTKNHNYLKTNNKDIDPNEYVSFIGDNLNEILDSAQIADRADIVLLSLLDDSVSCDTISKSLSKLRREDIATMIGSLINKDNKFTVINETVLEDNVLCDMKIDYNALKVKLLKSFMINEDSKDTIFNDIKMKDYSTKEKELLDSFVKKDMEVVERIKEKDNSSEEEYNLNMMLASYEIKNLVLTLSDVNTKRLCKSLNNIIKENETYVDYLNTNKYNDEYFEEDGDSLRANIRSEVPRLDVIKAYSKIRDLKIHELYRDELGLDNTKLNHNKNIDKSITYGVEVEEINVASNILELQEKNGFHSTSEYSLEIRNNDEVHPNKPRYREQGTYGEYVTSIFQAADASHLELVKDEFELLKDLGATTNGSCGMHIHVADKDLMLNNTEMKNKIASDIYYMQDALTNKFNVYKERTNVTCQSLESSNPDISDRYKVVNLNSLTKHGTIEFRFFNMPDELDPFLVESYIDFATSFYQYERFNEGYLGDKIEKKIDEDIHAIFKTDKEKYDYQLNEVLDLIGVTKTTKEVIMNQDKIFEFYGATESKDTRLANVENGIVNYYDRLNQNIEEIELENLNEEIVDDAMNIKLLPLNNNEVEDREDREEYQEEIIEA